jgi:V/A-type H+-transporting ATPase subunit I
MMGNVEFSIFCNMITPMSRVVVAATDASKEETLKSLREWGLLHVLHLQTPENEQVQTAKAALANAQKVFETLSSVAGKGANSVEEHNLLSQISGIMQSKKTAEEALTQSSAELKKVEAFGEFDPHSIRKLQKHGINVKLYSAEEKHYKGAGENFVVKEFKRASGEVFFATFSAESVSLPYNEIALPSKSVKELKKDMDSAIETIAECEKKLAAYAGKKAKVGELVVHASDDLAFKAASAGMRSEIGVCFIQGYCPKDKLPSLKELASKNGWGISAEEPLEDEAVPTLLKHKKAVKPIDALYSVIGISPGYREIDVSSVFLCFFSIFFAMIVGDTVYGLLFMGLTFFASKKFKSAPRYPFHFLYLMSGCTIAWGVLNASYLGLNTTGDVMVVPAVLDICKASWSPEGLKIFAAWIRDADNNKFLCFILAVIHLTIAHIWNAWAHRDSKATVISQMGWLCTTWLMFFLARNMVLGHFFPEPALYVGIAGVVFIIVGAAAKAEWFSIGMLPLNLVSNLVDVISYIRLFAVGMAGYSVANAFNGMVAPLFGSVPGAFGAALILLLVHALNIVLAAMGVAVHAVRLNTLEFSNNVGVEWSGSVFTPLKKNV